jgi:flagellar basal-body rod protein FlgF
MENAQLISLSRQIALQRQMDVVANNIANLNTTGFKGEKVLFEEFKMPVARNKDFAPLDRQFSYTQDWGTLLDLAPGALLDTGNPLDVALQGEGFLVVETPEGERWTRSGSLQINADGVLVTLDGHPVLGDGGALRFAANETDIVIDATGAVSSSAGAKGRLRIVEFDNPQELVREGGNRFAGGTPVAATETRLIQGAVEKSNVSGVAEMTQMIRVERAYQSLASLLDRQDDMRKDAIRRLGSLSA